MSNKSYAWMTASLLACILVVALLWRSWSVLGMVERYTGIALVASITLVTLFVAMRGIQELIKHAEVIATSKTQRKIIEDEHAHRLQMERDRFDLERHLAMTRLLPTEHGYAALVERNTPLGNVTVTQIPYAGRIAQIATSSAAFARRTVRHMMLGLPQS